MSLLEWSYRAARRLVVLVIGGTVLALGVALLVLPGPAFVVIPAGLAILALEFGWARRWGRGASRRAGPRERDCGGEARGEDDGERPPSR